MNISRSKIVLIALVVFGLGAGGFAYVKYRNFSDYLIGAISSQAGRKLGRQVKFKKIAFSPLEGVVIDEPCVSRAPDFSKGIFFCAARAVIRPELSGLMRDRLYFANVEFEKPAIKVREAGGKWDFEDLLALLPKTSKGLYLTWNAKKLTLKGATLEIDYGSSGDSTAFENADISILHYSALAGNFSLDLRGDLKTILKGQLATAKTSLKTELNFEYAGLTSAFGRLELDDAAMGAATLKKAALNWELFGIDKPAPEKNYSAGFRAEGLFIPAQSCGVSKTVTSAMQLLSSAMGKAAPRCDDIEMGSLTIESALKEGVLSVKELDLATNILNLKTRYELNGPARAVDITLAAEAGDNKLDLTARGQMDKPDILPVMSVTLNSRLTDSIRNVNAAFLKIFPIAAGEIPAVQSR